MPRKKYQIFDKLIEGVQVISPDWRYFYVNDSIARHGKSSKSELLDKTMMEKYPGIEHTEVFRLIGQCMKDKSPCQLINEFVFPDGSRGWFELSIQSVPEGVIILSSDITKQKKVEYKLAEKLKEREAMIAQITEHKKQLEDFCQIIAHNLRAPLSNLLLLNDMIKESRSYREKKQFLEKQEPVLKYLHDLFEELVEALQVRMDSLIRSNKVNLAKATSEVISLLQSDIIKSGAIIRTDFRKIKTINYPRKYIKSILLNLISNALKFYSPERRPEIYIRAFHIRGYVCLSVRDNGLGIDLKKNGNKVFKLRKTFHNHPESKGFGLFITKTQVESMNGKISVKSTVNEGSTFTVKLYKTEKHEKN